MEQVLVNGIVLSANYALIALGITLIFSIMSLLNFAHGQMFMIGGFMVYYVYGVWGLPYGLGLRRRGPRRRPDRRPVRAVLLPPRAAGGDPRGEQHAARGRHGAPAREPGPVRVRREAARRAARGQRRAPDRRRLPAGQPADGGRDLAGADRGPAPVRPVHQARPRHARPGAGSRGHAADGRRCRPDLGAGLRHRRGAGRVSPAACWSPWPASMPASARRSPPRPSS